ncbi:YmfQ family protein [Roseomonas xinghualingensis]|uniref:YmfQ family protein n=1 Tax=Roseomonas xinghualingensis TaxID=2986475 RepID=UPI0021F0CC44|nr:putative phage tail protein [Roseomonas sp. SXEYE001]MCV4209386.1 DUF2313 domain-containing protein [Roseomonas sp. SXEYE001]
MSAPVLNAEDFTQALADLLPVGAIWSRDPDAMLMRLVAGLAAGANAAHQRAQDLLLRESAPSQTVELLPDWERAYGLPDTCAPDNQGLQERQAALLARIAALGGQSRAYFIAVAEALGYSITIEEFTPARAGVFSAGSPLYGEDWAHTWRVHAPSVTVTDFVAGASAAGEPLAAWGNDALECVLNRLRPAHTILQIAYRS